MNIEQLSHLSLMKISGQDSESFLQGQLTSDVAKLSNSWQYAGYCNPKGRLLAILQLWRQDESFYALIANDLLEATTKRLRMYVMRSKVTIEKLDNYQLIGLLKRDSSIATLAHLKLTTKAPGSEQIDLSEYQHGDLVQAEKFCALIINERALIVRTQNSESKIKQTPEGDSHWLTSDISEGLPQVSFATAEQFIPQMLNLDLLGGISFKKGCYTGQEIVARMHYLGKLKQRMFSCDIAASDNTPVTEPSASEPSASEPSASEPSDTSKLCAGKPKAGDKVYTDPDHEKAVGTLVSINYANRRALAVLKLDSLDGPLRLSSDFQLNVSARQAYNLPD